MTRNITQEYKSMAILTKVTTIHGEEKELYIRVNNVEVNNHGIKACALVRGFLSKDAFDNRMHFLHEERVEFDADLTKPLWEQVYDELKRKYPESVDV